MSDLRDHIERLFAAWGRFAYRHRWWVIGLVLLLVGSLASQLPKIHFDTSTEGFLHPDDPILVEYNAFRDQFGRDELILLALQPPDPFDLAFLETLRSLHERIEDEVPHLEEVTSLINARATRGSEDELLVEDLLEEWPESEADLRALEAFVLGNPSYRNLLVSADGRTTTLVIQTSSYSSQGETDDFDAFDEEESGAPCLRIHTVSHAAGSDQV